MAENGVTLETLTKLALTPLVESGPQNLVHEDGPHGYVHSFYEICVPDAVKKFLIRNEKLPKEMSDLTMGHLKKAVEHFCGTGQAAVTLNSSDRAGWLAALAHFELRFELRYE